MDDAETLNLQETVARIERALAETSKFRAEHDKLAAEARKFAAEQDKLAAEARKLDRDRRIAPATMVATLLGSGAAIFAAGATFYKLLVG